ncbi:MAG TPA: ABC transporter permease [Gemmatimonadaceae bacterium]|nr:ABC transporter permease [Gemmatimonadaceae bacterium]
MSSSLIGGWYSLLLRLLPSSFRARYGAEMRRTFEDHWRESGPGTRLAIIVRAIADVVWTAIVVRLTPRSYASPAELQRLASGDDAASGISTDARAAVRGLLRRPAFAITAVITAALGIGATTAVFSVVDATVLRGLDVPQQNRVMSLWGTFERSPGQEFGLSLAEYADVRTEVKSLERVGAWSGMSVVLEPKGDRVARTLDAANTFGDIYGLVGARTVLGRLPDANDDRPGAPVVALLSHELWTTAFASDPRIIGGTLPVGSQSVEIVGVLAPDVVLPGQRTEVWIHRILDPAMWARDRSGHGLTVVGRLRPGAAEEGLRAELTTLQRTWASRYGGQHSFGLDGHAVMVSSLGAHALGTARRVGTLLSAAAVVLLLLACANVANLLLARGETRLAEVGVRIALGASSRRVAQPVVMEGLVIAILGGVLGLALAVVGLPVLTRLAPEEIARQTAVGIDIRVIAFAIVISLVTGVLFALQPAWKAARHSPATLLRSAGRGRSATMRGLRWLVAGQTALAALLLIGAALFARSLQKLTAVKPGLDPVSRVAVNLSLPMARYRDATAMLAFYEGLQQRVASLGGVQHVTLVRALPLRDNQRSENVVRDGSTRREDVVPVSVQLGAPTVLRTLGIALLEGRDLDARDRVGSPHVAVVNQSAAKTLWPGQSAIGKRVTATFAPSEYGQITIVGVYGDVRSSGLSAAPSPEIVLPLLQADGFGGWPRNMRLVVQTTGANTRIIPELRATLREMDAYIPVELPTTMSDVLRAGAARQRFLAALLAVFATLALIIAAVGVFGVVSFSVARQTRELAIRSALGADRADIARDVLRANAGVSAAGAIVGSMVAAVVAPALSGFLYDVSPRDGLVLTGVPVTLIAVAVLACVAPAIKAMRVPAARALQDSE